jgi:hypothetical protein
MIRIEITRKVLVKQGKGRNKINPVSVIFETTLDEALVEVSRWQEVNEDTATMPFQSAVLYDDEIFRDYLRSWSSKDGPFDPTPLRVIKS